ncbi:hypothetical protein BCR36DRAFT_367357 [Piromyces finnis]|uniref:Alpha/beta-hydrolase n=1 Tax=Piromyces finnis TaxID=1754191 RepID=A0A1Y1VJT7_9FUNG|nr:hypothetical protein BCR36DRAFT_367357 [Piromyces finnis]|eukprot:ORX57291.1 hypothetical protein BCR36DRAFT_367357 [Piromyces finnis]
MTEKKTESNEKKLDYTDSEEEILDLNGTSTKILYIKAKEIPKDSPRTVVIIVPGSPGVINYYRRFMGQIYDVWDKQIDIYGIEHMGHTDRKLEGNNVLFSNQQQIESKIAFFDKLKAKPEYSHPNTKFYLIGHSLGAYMVLRLFEERPNSGITKSFLLFPAIHEIEKTPRGISTFRFIKHDFERKMASIITKGLDFLPTSFKKSFVKTVVKQSEALNNVIYLTKYEREDIKSIEDHVDFINEHMNEFFFFYSINDGWATKDHYEILKEKLPEYTKYNNLHLDETGIPHAFVIGENWSRILAERLVYDWLKIKQRP